MADPLRHRQTKGAATDMVDLRPPRHIPTLPRAAVVARLMVWPVCPQLRKRRVRPAVTLGANLGQTHSRQTTWLEPAVEELASTWPSCSNVAKWLAPHRTPS